MTGDFKGKIEINSDIKIHGVLYNQIEFPPPKNRNIYIKIRRP
jgi:hypothetical protein